MSGEPRLDPAVLARARAGDQGAFAAVVATYEERLRGLVSGRMRGSAADVDDVLQQTWERAWRFLTAPDAEPGADRSEYLYPWLRRTAEGFCLHEQRRRRPVPAEAALVQSPARERRALALHHGDGYPVEDVATALGLDAASTKNLLRRAQRRVAREAARQEAAQGAADRHRREAQDRDARQRAVTPAVLERAIAALEAFGPTPERHAQLVALRRELAQTREQQT